MPPQRIYHVHRSVMLRIQLRRLPRARILRSEGDILGGEICMCGTYTHYKPRSIRTRHHRNRWQVFEGAILLIIGFILLMQYFGIDLGLQDLINEISSSTTITISVGLLAMQLQIFSHLIFGTLLLLMGLEMIGKSGRTQQRRFY